MDYYGLEFFPYRTYLMYFGNGDSAMSTSGLDTGSGASRDSSGRFLPGHSGNPEGKAPGTRNRATILRAALDDGEEMLVARGVIDKAKAGDGVSARFLLGLLYPRPRGRAITLDLPVDMSAGDTVAAFNATLLAMAAGEITPDEALTITRVFDGRLTALKAWELERHMTWVRRETIPGDDLFAPDDEENDDEESDDEEMTADTQTEPSPCGPLDERSGRQGEGAGATGGFDSADASRDPNPNPPERSSKGPQAGEGIAPSEPEPSAVSPAPESPAEHLHSACIELAQEAETAAFQAAQRKLSQWWHVLAQQPGFSADAYLKAEVAATLSAARR